VETGLLNTKTQKEYCFDWLQGWINDHTWTDAVMLTSKTDDLRYNASTESLYEQRSSFWVYPRDKNKSLRLHPYMGLTKPSSRTIITLNSNGFRQSMAHELTG
jgi:hypothetical protein